MMHAPITRDEMRDAIQSLHLVLPKFALTDETMPEIVDTYRQVMLPMDREAVQGAVKIGLRTWEKFPTPAAWRTTVREWIRHNRIAFPRDEETLRDAEGRAIICKRCRSVARSAWLRRQDGSEYSRLIAPCDPARHDIGQPVTMPPGNFLAWDDRTEAETNADNAALTAAGSHRR